MTALSYFVKMGETRSPELLQVAKEIWGYLLGNGIAVTPEYLPSILNIQADWQSRNHRDLSDWKLNTKIFYQIVKIIGIPQIDLFASWLNHQLPKYMSWHPGLGSCAVDSLQHSWRILYACAFPPYCLIGKVLAKVSKDQSLLLIVTPTWQTQPWYAALLAMSVQHYSVLRGKSTLCRKATSYNWWHGKFQESFERWGSIKTRCHAYHKFQKVRVNTKLPIGLAKVG